MLLPLPLLPLLLLLLLLGKVRDELRGEEIASETDWTYHNHDDPNYWPGICQTGKMQSPVNFATDILRIRAFEALDILDVAKTDTALVTNVGYTIRVKYEDDGVTRLLTGGGLFKTYRFDHIHFHWPSEHTVNGQRFAMESHFVYYDVRQSNLSTALHINTAVTILTVFYRLSGKDNPAIDRLKVSKKGVLYKAQIQFALRELLPENTEAYYRYAGSLTFPPCTEHVLYTLFTETSYVSERQMAAFKDLRAKSGEKLNQTFRPIRDKRHAHTSYQKQTEMLQWYSCAKPIHPTAIVIMFNVMMVSKLH